MILLHAIVPRQAAELADAGLRAHDAENVSVLYEERTDPPPSDRTAVLAHGRRVLALADRVTVLPVRYGTTLPSVEELGAVVAEHAAGWGRSLDRLAGRCELVVHVNVVAPEERPPGEESGRAYLHRRMAQVQRQDRAFDEVRALLSGWAVETCLLADRRRLAVLVDRGHADLACRAVADWGGSQDDLDLLVTGPWPPFSFCEDGALP